MHSCAIRSDGVRMCWGNDGNGANPDLRIDPALLPASTLGQAYSQQLTLVGIGGYSASTPAFVVVDGDLPTGLTMATGGLLSGTPATEGTFAFTVEAEDGNGFVARQVYVLIVQAIAPVDAVEVGIEDALAAGYISAATAEMFQDLLDPIQTNLDWITANPSSPQVPVVKAQTCTMANSFIARMDHYVRARRLSAELRDDWKADMLEVKADLGCRT